MLCRQPLAFPLVMSRLVLGLHRAAVPSRIYLHLKFIRPSTKELQSHFSSGVATTTISSRIRLQRLQRRLKFHSNPHLSTRVLQSHFSSSVHVGARSTPRSGPHPGQHPPPSPPEAVVESPFYIPMPEGKTEEPGSGLMKIFLVITIPILLLSQADEIARYCVTPDEVREALNLDPTQRPPVAAYNYYIYNYKPGLVSWLKMGQAMKRHFSFTPANFVENTPGDSFRWWTLLTSEFNHGGVIHLLVCYTALKTFVPTLVQMYGGRVTTVCFLAGGVLAEAFVGFYEKTTNPLLKLSPAEIKQKSEVGFTKEEKKLYHRAFSWHLGSSTSLMTIGTICAIVYPSMEINLMFIPIGIPIRAAIGIFAAFDLGGMIWDYGLPIGHSGHIGGAIGGLLLYQFWVRKLPTIMQQRFRQMMREKGINV